jgi:hypothetical protein
MTWPGRFTPGKKEPLSLNLRELDNDDDDNKEN